MSIDPIQCLGSTSANPSFGKDYHARGMKPSRIWIALCLVVALAVGQLAAPLHQLAHATESLRTLQDPGTPAPQDCDQHFLWVQLSGGAASMAPTVALLALADPIPAVAFEYAASSPPLLAFRSRAPPFLA